MKIEQTIRDAYDAGVDKRKNGANTTNCNLRHFDTHARMRAWEAGEEGRSPEDFFTEL